MQRLYIRTVLRHYKHLLQCKLKLRIFFYAMKHKHLSFLKFHYIDKQTASRLTFKTLFRSKAVSAL